MTKDLTLYPTKLKSQIEAIPADYWEMGEKQLRKQAKPSLTEYEMKVALWGEIDASNEMGRKISVYNIYSDVCSEAFFYKTINNLEKLAWLMSPLRKYEDKAAAALEKATERYEELLSMEITTTRKVKNKETGQYEEVTQTDPKKAAVLLATIKNVEERVKGMAVQKQISVHEKGPKDKKYEENMEEINKRLTELRESERMKELPIIEAEVINEKS